MRWLGVSGQHKNTSGAAYWFTGCPEFDCSHRRRRRRRSLLPLQRPSILIANSLEAKETNPSRLLSYEISIWDTSFPMLMNLEPRCNPQPLICHIIHNFWIHASAEWKNNDFWIFSSFYHANVYLKNTDCKLGCRQSTAAPAEQILRFSAYVNIAISPCRNTK